MTDALSITSSQAEGKANVTVFHLSGVLNASSEDELYEQACQAFDSGVHYLLLDMGNLTHISSAGLRALHNIFMKCTAPNCNVEGWVMGFFPQQIISVQNPIFQIGREFAISHKDLNFPA